MNGAVATNGSERRQAMGSVRLTRRGRIVRNIAIALLALGALALIESVTTPEQCKVPLEQMSQFCKDLRYP